MKTQSLLASLALLAVNPVLQAQTTTFTWGAPRTGTWENGVAFGAGSIYVNDLSVTGSTANFTSLSGATAVNVNGTVEAYQLGHNTGATLALNVGTGTPLIRLGAGGINQISSSSALTINTGIEVTTGQAWVFTAGNTFAGVVSGSGNLAITTGSSRGQLWSNAGNTYNGTITVTAGQLFTDKSTGFQYATLDTTGISGVYGFRWSQAANTIGALQGSGNLQLARKSSSIDNNDRGGMTLTIGNNNSSTTFSGNLSQAATATSGSPTSSIIKVGSGTQTFSGANTYNGTTTVSGGTLLLNGTHITTTGTSSYSVTGTGSTLGGTGRIAVTGGVSVASGAILAPGASIGTLTLDGINSTGPVLSMASGAVFDFELDGSGGTPDRLDFWNYNNGDLVLNNNAINLSLLGSQAAGTYTVDIFRFYSDSGTTGVAHGFNTGLVIGTVGADIQNAFIVWTGSMNNYDTIALTYTVIPEPSTWALLVGSLAVLVVYRLRRRTA